MFLQLAFKIITYLLLVLAFLYCGLYYAYSPQLSGSYSHTHSDYSNVSIRRDEFGIPHIKGNNFNSVCYGQGFATAQDRLFSMYVKRALVQGRLSELDSVGVSSDIFFRTVGVGRIAQKAMKTLSKQSLGCLEGYARGVNDYYHSLTYKPLEFLITGAKWTDWTPYDSICFLKFMNFLLSLDYMFEPLRTQLAEQFGVEDSFFMTGIHPDKQLLPVTVLNDEELKQSGIFSQYNKNKTHQFDNQTKFTAEQKQRIMNSTLSNLLYDIYSVSYGSNSWVIHGNHTKSGKPLLSNDPHLKNSIPSTWYQSELLIEDQNKTIHGVSMPGIPFILIGRTDFASWGITVLYSDNTDLYVEKTEGDKYLLDGEWKDLRKINETIYVKGADPIHLEVRFTHRGPLMDYTTDFHYKNPFQKHGLQTSLAFTGQIEVENSLDTFMNIIQANTTQQIRDSLANSTGPALSIVYSTSTGDIGFYGISRLPYTNYPQMGPLLKDGTTTLYDWVNITNQNENPQIINPKKGYIVSANNKFATNNINHHFSVGIQCTPRASRINELIQKQIKQGKKFDIEDMKRIMTDTLDIYAREVIPHINTLFQKFGEKVLNNDSKLISQANNTLQQLLSWDFHFDADSVKAPYFSAWEFLYSDKSMHSFNTTAENRATLTKGRLFWHFQFSKIIDWSKGINTNYNELWCRSEQNSHSEYACLYNVIISLAETQSLLDEKYQQESDSVKNWGALHTNEFSHFPFSKTILKIMYHRSIPGFGNARTVAVSIPNYLYNSFHANQGANYRVVYDMSEPHEKNYYLIDTGISENIFSPHYDDQLKMHVKFQFIEMKSGFKNFMSNSKYIYELRESKQQKNNEL